MTEKLYYKDSYLKKFKANIKDYFKKEGNYHLILNKTAFYPEGGGQPADKGMIGEQKVQDVYQKDDKIYHIVEQLPKNRDNLNCKINWDRRFDHMQQHTAQHLLSAIFQTEVEAKTISFHLGRKEVTIDLDKELSRNSIQKIEDQANQIIYNNKDIRAEFPGDENLKNIKLRKEPKVEENIRIVRIDQVDICACGGTHLKKSGDIGIIKIIDYKNYKGGMRIYFMAGKRALKDYQFKNKIVIKARQQFGVKDKEINTEIEALQNDLKNKKYEINELNDKLLAYKAVELISEAEKIGDYNLICGKFNEMDLSDLKLIAEKISDQKNNLCVLGQNKDSTARILMAKSKNIKEFKINEMMKKVMEILDGNGGGHQFFAQGGSSNPEKLNAALKEARKMFQKSLNKIE